MYTKCRKSLETGIAGGLKLDQVQFEFGLNRYYRQSGCDLKTSASTRQTAERLSLDWIGHCFKWWASERHDSQKLFYKGVAEWT